MDKNNYLGTFEEMVLLSVYRLGNAAYGVPIRQEVERLSGRDVSVGALYTALDRLEQKGYIKSRQGEATPERGGRAKKYFRVEGSGVQALEEMQRVHARMLLGNGLVQKGGAA
ncbi:MAG: PadR family transcriptional regulator [Armatimonadota bacterium]|nr:PadR family transcriptional regulator [Armatimonadota bacterium]